MEEDLIVEIWDMFREFISEKNKENAANAYVDFLVGRDVENSIFEGLMGYDPHLDNALEAVLSDDDKDEDVEDDDWSFEDQDED